MVLRNCVFCGKEFEAVVHNKIYCCQKCKDKRYRTDNKEKISNSRKLYKKRNLAKIKKYQKLYRDTNKENRSRYNKENREKNKLFLKEFNQLTDLQKRDYFIKKYGLDK
jgi:predicted  nucleic acid-binding Zn-ribbon protein